MRFVVFSERSEISLDQSVVGSQAVLHRSIWNDAGFTSQFTLYVSMGDGAGARNIGVVKIAKAGTHSGRTDLPNEFNTLEEDQYFSLGQSDSYYENLKNLPHEMGREILESIRDVAISPERFGRWRKERVMMKSLLREVAPETVKGQFRRMAQGGARLSRFAFTFTVSSPSPNGSALPLSFKVEPESLPPSNIHVLIGRNGVGKTHTLQSMVRAHTDPASTSGSFMFPASANTASSLPSQSDRPASSFAGLISVAFSAFDSFVPVRAPDDRSGGGHYVYVGLRSLAGDKAGKRILLTTDELAEQFAESLATCIRLDRGNRWLRAVKMLGTDPVFQAIAPERLLEGEEFEPAKALELFDEQLSSGHKIVLLTATRLVEHLEEGTIVLLDEPESHLHPPLLSAFLRSLSDLLIDRNAVAVVATHSPVVLQEVPKSCVSIVRRSGDAIVSHRPAIETFGANVGVLTHEIFGLEAEQSGFYRLLADAVQSGASFAEVEQKFGSQLGGEAVAMTHSLIAVRDAGR